MRRRAVATGLVAALLTAACSGGSRPLPRGPLADPRTSVSAKPDYLSDCAPYGLDNAAACLQVALDALDNARAKEGLQPMQVPSDLGRLSVPQQLLIAIDDERTARGLPPLAGLSASLSADDESGADASTTPSSPGPGFSHAASDWIGDVSNGLDVDYEWVYDDGPGSGQEDCSKTGDPGCWTDRHFVLSRVPGRGVLGAAVNPTAYTDSDNRDVASVAATIASDPTGSALTYTWTEATSDIATATLAPLPTPDPNESATGFANPPQSESPDPDYTTRCADSGFDSSSPCIQATLAAINNARAAEHVTPMLLPQDFDAMPVTEQVFVAIDLERVDRGLRPFEGVTAELDANAQLGANKDDDPPEVGSAYDITDGEWAGGSSNGLDAVYGWMYDDGTNAGNLDCPAHGGGGCWGHREGILDDFGTIGRLEMGVAVNPTADNNAGDKGGTSIAATLAETPQAPAAYLYMWAAIEGSRGATTH